jgi:hypothetical protein
MTEMARELPTGPRTRPPTQVADGVPRLRWTLAEFERLIEVGTRRQTLITLVHREPSADRYATATNVPRSEMLIPLLAAPLAIRLAALELS